MSEDGVLTLWVDADACPREIKEVMFRAAQKREFPLRLVANTPLSVPPSEWIRFIQVPAGFDVADNYIVQNVNAGDIAITQDIPLAAELVALGVHVISVRGERYTENNIRQRLTMRNFMEEMRSSGEQIGGPKAFSQKDKQVFSNVLDRLLTRLMAS